MTFRQLSPKEHVTADGKWRATNPHPTVAMSPWKLERMTLGRWEWAGSFRTMGELRTHLTAKTSRTRVAESRRWFGSAR